MTLEHGRLGAVAMTTGKREAVPLGALRVSPGAEEDTVYFVGGDLRLIGRLEKSAETGNSCTQTTRN